MRYRPIFPLKGWVRALVYITVFFFLCSFLYGCVSQKSYKVLSFFFDGVPNPDEKPEQSKSGGSNEAAARAPKAKYREHGPYAAKLCNGCHQRGTNVLILPVEKLCLNCHIIQTGKKYIHGPVAA